MRRVRPSARALSGSARARRLRTIHPERLGLAPEGEVASAFGCGFALADVRDRPAPAVERLHRHRAQVEERLKDAELGQPLPSGDANASRPWMTAVLAALDLAAMPCDPSPLAGACGAAREDAPLRRHAKALRRALPCVAARITCHARVTTLRLAAGHPHLAALEATWAAAYALPPP